MLPSEIVRSGEYEHYKGMRYEVIGTAAHTESNEIVVVYRALYGAHQLYARPISSFIATVEHEGKQVLRFKRIGL